MFYKILRKILFLLPPELAHSVTIAALNFLHYTHLNKTIKNTIQKPVTINGIHFSNPIGIAAGFDKYAKALPGLSGLGLGFAELGTFTAKPQIGNSKPRLFRLPLNHSIINWMGLNNVGIDAAIDKIKKITRANFPIGISISKNNDTAYEDAAKDYEYCIEKAYLHCDYITANISCPNVVDSNKFWGADFIVSLLNAIKSKQLQLAYIHHKYVPIFIKISPDLSEKDIQAFADVMNQSGLDGVVATNTSSARPDFLKDNDRDKKGGLSGEALFEISLQCVKYLHRYLKPEITLVGLGGIHSPESAQAMFDAGCKLIQIYTGFVYEGPGLISRILKKIE